MKTAQKVLMLALVMTLLNPKPLVSDAQVRSHAMNPTPKPKPPVVTQNVQLREPSSLQWFCFHPEQVTVEQSEVLYNGNAVSMPQMQAISENESYEISLSGEVTGDYDAIFSSWQELLRSAHNVCVSVEFLQTLESVEGRGSSLWTIKSLKTDLGEWKASASASMN